MEKLKKYIIVSITLLICIILYGTTVQAKDHGNFEKGDINQYGVGDTMNINENIFYRDQLYCVEHNQVLPKQLTKYRLVAKVNIVGNVSTDYKGKQIKHRDNAVLVGILTGTDKGNRDPMRNAIWNFMHQWVTNVGQHHAGINFGFASTVPGNYVPELQKEAEKYADSLEKGSQKLEDKTDKKKIKVKEIKVDNKSYTSIGPFKYVFSGKLTKISPKDQNGKTIKNALIGTYEGKTMKWQQPENIKSGKQFYIAIPNDGKVSKITKVEVTAQKNVRKSDIWFFKSTVGADQNVIYFEPGIENEKEEITFDYDILIEGKLKIVKVDEDNNKVKLEGVGFYIQNKDTGKYVKKDANGKISYVDDKSQATEFITDEKGEILIENLIVGTYIAYESKNPNYGYEIITDGVQHDVVADKTEELKITNKRTLIKLSGYVWEDIVDGKQSYRNDLYQNGVGDTQDKLLEGITVRLKDKEGKIIKEAKTDSNGAYLFVDVLIKELSNYYIEFEYDGLTYEPVAVHLDKENGSKASEAMEVRKDFNGKFAEVQGTGETTGITLDESGNKAHDLTYVKDKSAYTSTFVKEPEKYLITATTKDAGYDLMKQYTGKEEEIKNINLGVYERERPDLAVMKDVQNAKVSVNGYTHTYKYAERFKNQGEYTDGFNVGVKFGNKYGTMSYTRAIYKSDVEYSPQDASKELKVYMTYQIRMANQATNIAGRVNSVVDYYDARYNITKAGTGIDENGNITGELKYSEPENYNDQYKKVIIYNTEKIEAQKSQDIYVQFELNKDAVLAIMNDKETLENTVEINSYASFDKEGNIYAGIDVDSNPGNIVPGDKTTYEDDTDSAPSMKLELTNARQITGKVFLDETSPTLLTGQIREGDGEFKEGEKGIAGVKVTLKNKEGRIAQIYDEDTKQWVEAKDITTNENGDFSIRGYVPDEYILTYTWGDDTYTIQNYKGTIYNDRQRASNPEWYKQTTPRYSDAMDDWDLRKAIDKQTAAGVQNGEQLITKMDSNTPMMRFGVEFESIITDNSLEYELDENGNVKKDEKGYVVRKDSFLYRVSNVDFGIAERPRQELDLDKHVKTVKITLANGSVLIDAKINEQGKLEGQIQGVTGGPELGFVKAEVDSEILQQSHIEIGYEIIATNISEYDYISENGDYYFFGKEQVGKDLGELVKLKVGELRDYLDETLVYIDMQDGVWQMDEEDHTIKGRNAFVTQKLGERALAPKEKVSVEIKCSRELANADEIEFENLAVVQKLSTVPEFYGPKLNPPEDPAEPVTVTTPTGANQNYIVPITIGLSTLVILGAGVWFIKKKVLNK